MAFSLPEPNPQSETKETRLLGIALPAIPEILDILKPIMEKYQIPKILPENKELSKTVIAQRTNEEWELIRNEIELNLRDKFTIIPPQLMPSYKNWKKDPETFLTIRGLDRLPKFLKEPITKLLTAILLALVPAFQIADQINKSLSVGLFDYMTKGTPLSIPSYFVGEAVRFTFPDGDKVVLAFASQLANPSEVAERFRMRIIETFGPRPELTEDNLRGAEYRVLEKYGMSREQIALIDMDRHPKLSRKTRKSKLNMPPILRRRKTIDKSIERSMIAISKIVGDNE